MLTTTTNHIVAFAGRRIDNTASEFVRFPLINSHSVKSKIGDCLTELQCRKIVCSGACGADLLALSTALEMGISIRLILPFDISTFRKISVDDRPGNWGNLFDEVIRLVRIYHQLDIHHFHEGCASTFLTTNGILLETAEKEMLAIYGATMSALVAWDGVSYGLNDATADFVNRARDIKLQVREINTSQSYDKHRLF